MYRNDLEAARAAIVTLRGKLENEQFACQKAETRANFSAFERDQAQRAASFPAGRRADIRRPYRRLALAIAIAFSCQISWTLVNKAAHRSYEELDIGFLEAEFAAQSKLRQKNFRRLRELRREKAMLEQRDVDALLRAGNNKAPARWVKEATRSLEEWKQRSGGDFGRCIIREFAESKAKALDVTVVVTTSKQGTLEVVKVTGPKGKSSRSCIQRTVRAWTLPPSEAGKRLRFTFRASS